MILQEFDHGKEVILNLEQLMEAQILAKGLKGKMSKVAAVAQFCGKELLKDFGNSGYNVRPSERRKGYATKMLAMIKDVAKEAGMTKLQLSVERDNEPSLKTIVKNGGVYERSFEFQGELADVYMVDL